MQDRSKNKEAFMKINILLFDNFETLDIFGPIEVLARQAGHSLEHYSLHGGVITSAQHTQILTLPADEAEPTGVLVLPGGMGTRQLVNDPNFIAMIKRLAEASEYCLSICTGSALLAKAGVLNGKKATSNKKAFTWATSNSDQVDWQKKARWVVDGKYYTASGVSAGIDMSLGFIADLYGDAAARKIASDIEYIWNDDHENDPFAVE